MLNCIRGDLGADDVDLPRVPGHELVGKVAAVGHGVDPARVGERVMAYFYLCCGECRRCLEGPESLCDQLAGVIGVHRDGGYAEYTALPARNLLPLPAALGAGDATAIPDAIATPVHVAARAGIRPGDRVAVTAAGGGVGIHMVQVARVCGAEVAGLEAVPEKLRFLEEELSVAGVDSSDFDSVSLPPDWRGRADVVVDLVGSRASLSWAVGALAPNGRLVVLTTFPGIGFEVSPRELVFRQATIVGSRYASRAELGTASRLAASGRVRPIVTRVVDAGGIDAVHDQLRRGELIGRGAVSWEG